MQQSRTDQGRKVHRYLDKITELKTTGSCFPVHFEVDLTNKCALKCKGCHSMSFRDKTTLTLKGLADIFGQLKAGGVRSILFAGGGDPLESEHWRDAFRMAREHGFTMALYSYLPKLTQNDVDYISEHCKFVLGHNTKADVRRPVETKCKWMCGWLLDSSNWQQIPKMAAQCNESLYECSYFRPLLTFTDKYEWVPEALKLLKSLDGPRVRWADHKFEDLMRPDKGRDYGKCYGTFFAGVVGADGSIWECCNRMGFDALGNAFTDGIENSIRRNLKPRTDYERCPPGCKNQKMNQILWEDYFGPEPENVEFL